MNRTQESATGYCGEPILSEAPPDGNTPSRAEPFLFFPWMLTVFSYFIFREPLGRGPALGNRGEPMFS